MAYKVVVSKAGYDATSETDPNNLIMDTSLNHLKTKTSGTVTVLVNASSTAQQTIYHNIGYEPLVLAYYRDSSNTKWFIASAEPSGSTGRLCTMIDVELSVDDTYVYFNVINGYGTSKSVGIKYEIFYEGSS